MLETWDKPLQLTKISHRNYNQKTMNTQFPKNEKENFYTHFNAKLLSGQKILLCSLDIINTVQYLVLFVCRNQYSIRLLINSELSSRDQH